MMKKILGYVSDAFSAFDEPAKLFSTSGKVTVKAPAAKAALSPKASPKAKPKGSSKPNLAAGKKATGKPKNVPGAFGTKAVSRGAAQKRK